MTDPAALRADSPAEAELPVAPALDVVQLYAEHAGFIGRLIERLAGPGGHVDDLLQETFIVAFKKLNTFNGRGSARSWLYGIASNLCKRHRRSLFRFSLARHRLEHEPSAPPASRPDQLLEREQAIALVREVLQRLPFKQREVFVLYELEKIEGEAIAELLGVPVGTVWTRLHHARLKFKAHLSRRLGAGRPA